MTLSRKLALLRVVAWVAICVLAYVGLTEVLGPSSTAARVAGLCVLLCLLVALYRFALRFVRATGKERA